MFHFVLNFDVDSADYSTFTKSDCPNSFGSSIDVAFSALMVYVNVFVMLQCIGSNIQ